MITAAKRAAGNAAAALVENNMVIGIGTGSTVAPFIEALGLRCRENLTITATASSLQTEQLAKAAGIPLIDPSTISNIDLTIDGADEIDPNKNMIKGGGGALLREKILAVSSNEMVVIVDESKLVDHLGVFPVPVEILPFAYQTTLLRLEQQGFFGAVRRDRNGNIYRTDNGNYIADIKFQQPIINVRDTHIQLKNIIGVLETGLFYEIASRVIIGYPDGHVDMR